MMVLSISDYDRMVVHNKLQFESLTTGLDIYLVNITMCV